MSLILNIDTATETAHISIAKDGVVLKACQNATQKDHASFLQPAIRQIIIDTAVALLMAYYYTNTHYRKKS